MMKAFSQILLLVYLWAVSGNLLAAGEIPPTVRAKLMVTVSKISGSYDAGSEVGYSVVVSNTGPEAVTSGNGGAAWVQISPKSGLDQLSMSAFSLAGGAQRNVSATLPDVVAEYVNLPSGSSITYTISGKVVGVAGVQVRLKAEVRYYASTAAADGVTGEIPPGPNSTNVYGFVAEAVSAINFPISFTLSDDNNQITCSASAIDVDVDVGGAGDTRIAIRNPSCFNNISGGAGNLLFDYPQWGSKSCQLVSLFRYADATSIRASGSCLGASDGTPVADTDGDGIADASDPEPTVPLTGVCDEDGNGNVSIANVTYAGTTDNVCLAQNSIVTGSGVQVGPVGATPEAGTIYVAGKSIKLLPGFSVPKGNSFIAGIEADLLTKSTIPTASTATKSVPSAVVSQVPLRLIFAQLPAALRALLIDAGATARDMVMDAEGGQVVFATDTALVSADENGLSDIYHFAVAAETLSLLSVNTVGRAGNGASRQSRIDGGGHYVVYASEASDLIKGDTNSVSDIYLYALETARTERVSLGLDGQEAIGSSQNPAIGSGRPQILYDRMDATGFSQIYSIDYNWPAQGTVALGVPVNESGNRINSLAPGISADSRYVTYLELEQRGVYSAGCSVHLYDQVSETFNREPCPAGLEDGKSYTPVVGGDAAGIEWIEDQPL